MALQFFSAIVISVQQLSLWKVTVACPAAHDTLPPAHTSLDAYTPEKSAMLRRNPQDKAAAKLQNWREEP